MVQNRETLESEGWASAEAGAVGVGGVTNPSKIIGISGGSGAGKTTLANALLEHYASEGLVDSSRVGTLITARPQHTINDYQ